MNTSIVIALPKTENAKKIRMLLVRHNLPDAVICTTGAGVLSCVSDMDCGIVICGYRLPDMFCQEIAEALPKTFETLLLASPQALSELPVQIQALEMPVRAAELVKTVSSLMETQERRWRKQKKRRSWREENYIVNAKRLLMERKHMTEEDAHYYLQKYSMDSGINVVETAQMILMMMLND